MIIIILIIIIIFILIIVNNNNYDYDKYLTNLKHKILYKYNFDELWVIFINDLTIEPINKTDINIPYIKKISRNTIIEMKDIRELEEILLLIKDNNNDLKKEIKKLEFEIARNIKKSNQCLLTLKEGFIIYKNENNITEIYKYYNNNFYEKKYGIMNICKNKNKNQLNDIYKKLKSFYDVYLLLSNINKPITIELLNNFINNLN